MRGERIVLRLVEGSAPSVLRDLSSTFAEPSIAPRRPVPTWIPMSPTTSSEFVRPFAALRRGDTLIAGGKGANLGELTAAGIPVPPGFVVTASEAGVHVSLISSAKLPFGAASAGGAAEVSSASSSS